MSQVAPGRPRTDAPDAAAMAGRSYRMAEMHAIFKADGEETGSRYVASERWLEPGCEGPGAHSHEADDAIFHAIEGMPCVLVGKDGVDAPAGSCIVIPAGVTHNFANRTQARAGLVRVFLPGGFEKPLGIVDWCRPHG